VKGYLLDTNHLTAWEVQWQAQGGLLIEKLEALPKDTVVCTSAINLGEMSAGHEMTSGDPQRRHKVNQFLNICVVPFSVAISNATRSYYGQIMGRIWKQHPPSKASISSDTHLVALGVNINDVWVVACAWEHGLTLLTTDSMAVIRAVVRPDEVTFDNWLI
jgi:predicted nucleic acid-binding protein